MSKITYTNLKLKTKEENKEIEYNGNKIEVLQYLPIEDKNDLISISLQKSMENNVYNEIKLDMYFHLNLIYMYTNISFTEKQREDESKLYDSFKSNGVLDLILEAIPTEELDELYAYVKMQQEKNELYSKTINSLIKNLIEELPKSAENAKNIIDTFDKEKYQEVLNFAKAANGDRPIK